jgi:hypothetical protein
MLRWKQTMAAIPYNPYIVGNPIKTELVQAIYRLTGGQPFYTQVICQNLVDHLMEEGRSDPEAADLERIVKGIVDNPLPLAPRGPARSNGAPSSAAPAQQAPALPRAELAEVVLAAGSGPFRVAIDGGLTLTSEGQEDERRIVVPNLTAGVHRFSLQNPATGETILLVAEVDEQRRYVEAAFKHLVAARTPASPRKAPETAPSAPASAPAGTASAGEAETAAPKGSLFLSSVPPGARITLDGLDTGLSTPYPPVAVRQAGKVPVPLRGFPEPAETTAWGLSSTPSSAHWATISRWPT